MSAVASVSLNSRPHKMWLLIFCVVVIVSGAFAEKDVILESMYGLGGRNKVAICVRTASGWRRCDGALYNREWVLARALCLGTAPVANLTAERVALGGTCDKLAASGNVNSATSRRVHELVLHPWFDLALLIMRTPYNELDKTANITQINNRLRPHGVYRWMKHYINAPCFNRSPSFHHKRLQKHTIVLLHPFWYFSVTMLLPTVLYLMFFVYVTFYTGTSCSTDKTGSYTELHYSKKVTHI